MHSQSSSCTKLKFVLFQTLTKHWFQTPLQTVHKQLNGISRQSTQPCSKISTRWLCLSPTRVGKIAFSDFSLKKLWLLLTRILLVNDWTLENERRKKFFFEGKSGKKCLLLSCRVDFELFNRNSTGLLQSLRIRV